MKAWAAVMCFVGAGACASEPGGIGVPDTAELIARCAPKVDVETLGAIVRAESNGHVFVLSDDGPAGLPWNQRKNMIRSIFPGSAEEAADVARKLILSGHMVGIGLTQINSQNLRGLGVTVDQLLDPCTNLAVGARLLRSLYQQALRSKRFATQDQALGAAVSAYNTGSFRDGFSNGYVRKVLDNIASGVPRLRAEPGPLRIVKNANPDGGIERSAPARQQMGSLAMARTAPLDVDW